MRVFYTMNKFGSSEAKATLSGDGTMTVFYCLNKLILDNIKKNINKIRKLEIKFYSHGKLYRATAFYNLSKSEASSKLKTFQNWFENVLHEAFTNFLSLFVYFFFIAFVFHVQEGLYIVRNHIEAFFSFSSLEIY